MARSIPWDVLLSTIFIFLFHCFAKCNVMQVFGLSDLFALTRYSKTIYLLLDIIHFFPNKTETLLVSFLTAFAIPWGLVKLIRGFWLLDHNDYEVSMKQLS